MSRSKLLGALVLVALCASSAQAQVAFETSLAPVSVSFLAAGETETVAADAGTGANRLLTVGVCWRDRGNVITGVTYNGVALTELAAKTTENAVFSAHLWRLAAPASGSNNIAVTMGAGSNASLALIGAWVANTVDGGTPVDAYTIGQNSAAAGATTSSVTVSSAANDRVFVLHCFRNDSEESTATPTNYTERQEASNAGSGITMAFGDAAGAASVATSALWTDDAGQNVQWIALGVNVNAAGGGAAVPCTMMLMGVGRCD